MFKLAQLHASSTFKIWLLGENKWNLQLERFSVDQTIVNQDYESGFKKLSSMNFLVCYAIMRVSTFQYLCLKITHSFTRALSQPYGCREITACMLLLKHQFPLVRL